MHKTNDVIGLGNTMMDFLIEVDDTTLASFNLKKGEMHLVDEIKAQEVLSKVQNLNVETVPGGSSANTIKGISFLGGKTIMCGKVGEDKHGEQYIQEMEKFGMTSRIGKHPLTTAHAVTFITPDTERTFSVHLGAALELYIEDILEEDIQNSKVLHIEAYQLEGKTKETVLHAIELAKKHNTLVSIDLADPALIRRNKELFTELVKDSIDIIFMNEKEAKEFTGLEEEEALKDVAQYVKIAVVKLGEKGSLIHDGETITRINSVQANAIDTTGAGDTFAAGFLYGYCNNWDTKKSGDLGSLFASKVVEQKGVGLKGLDKDKLKDTISTENLSDKKIKIGIIGGSGLDDPEILQNAQDIDVQTPYGKSSLKVGTINDINVVLLARHGRNHSIPPTQINFRANIHALKEAGCTHIIATTACGSLRKDIGRGDFVILDQFIDFTRHRKVTFHEEFKDGNIIHTAMAKPFNDSLRNILINTCQELNLQHHTNGTVITIEGPRFSTKAESTMFRSWGADVINMSVAPEAALAMEAGIPYAAVAMSTDYDCLFDDVPSVTWEDVLQVFKENVSKVISLLTTVIPHVGNEMPIKKTEFDLKNTIRTVPNWPKDGIMIRDITTLLQNPDAFNNVIQQFKERYQNSNITKIAGIDSRGFIFGSVLARELHLPFVLIRKKGKLPPTVISQEYQLEYGTDTVEINDHAINKDDTVLVVDDLIALGGTAHAACTLIEKCGSKVHEVAVVIELPDCKGREKLHKYDVFSLVKFEGD
ncbi:S-methyl-5'-thioadenosine phosphorylase [Candidatus Woesearchaeota archaeon]|nr:S-methyl-5'-thioadenosine phosphorylase [Candidatus Woesearchaeota archaeon]